ncbi:MAG: tetratricopeptide repeat protein [Burkholderiales bacterium]
MSDDEACVAALRQIESLLARGDARAALAQSRDLLADERTPPLRIATACALAARAAQTEGLAEIAEPLWRVAVARSGTPADTADALANLGALLAGQQRGAEAEVCCDDALALDSDHVVALANLALRFAETGRVAEAETHYRRALALDPSNAPAHSNFGVLLAAAKRLDEAERSYRRALELAPEDASAHTNLGLLLQAHKRWSEAESHQRRALALSPQSAEIHSNLGNLLGERGDANEAEALLRRALVLDPARAATQHNLAVLLADQRRDAEAEPLFRRAIELRPGYPLARLGLSFLLLAQGRFEEGWPLHEARHDPALPDNGIAAPPLTLPAWRGEPLEGKAALVWPEQGLGDQIQFCRYASHLKARGAKTVTLVCQKPLQTLFESLGGVDRVVAADVVDNAFTVDDATLRAHDVWVFPLTLPMLLHTELATLPVSAPPYLRAPPDRVAAWAARVPRDAALNVGLVWRGNPLHDNDTDRSLPDLATLAPLWSVPGVRFVSLQPGRAALAANPPPATQPLLPLGHALRDFADTAAVLEAIDLLITVDTSIAHLAGALGKPCWVMLPWHKTDWRWLRDRDDSPWYPTSMRLFRQTRRGDWAGVVGRVHKALAARSRSVAEGAR